jgi:hypothetical protein
MVSYTGARLRVPLRAEHYLDAAEERLGKNPRGIGERRRPSHENRERRARDIRPQVQ